MHTGQLLKETLTRSDISISRFATKLGYERSYIYRLFEKENLDFDLLIKAGRILNHDFSNEIPEIKDNILMNTPYQLNSDVTISYYVKENESLKRMIMDLQADIIKVQKENMNLMQLIMKNNLPADNAE